MDMFVAMSPGSRRIYRGREGYVLDNVTTAPYVTNDVEQEGCLMDNCPDEMVIFGRGRRSIPLSFSPDFSSRQRLSMGPVVQPRQVSRLLLPSRTSPRKRLALSDSPPTTPQNFLQLFEQGASLFHQSDLTNHKTDQFTPVQKKAHLRDDYDESKDPATSIKALTKDQLVSLISDIMKAKPEFSDEISRRIPEPDLNSMESSLRYLKQNINRALPNTRLESKTDSMAFSRVSTHLHAFKKTLFDQAKSLSEACSWKAVINHALMAWVHVKSTPEWDNPSHNSVRKMCFKVLANNCLTALKRGTWSLEFLQGLKIKFKTMEKDSDDMTVCLKHLECEIH